MLVVLSGGGGAFRADKFLVNGIDAARQMICGSNYSTGHGDGNGGPMSDYEFVSNALVSPNLISIAASKEAAVVPQGSAGGTQGAFILTRSGNLNAVTVQLAVSGGAVPGTDYAALPATCTFPVGVNSITLPVKPLAGAQAASGTRIVLSIQPSSRYQVAVSGSATVFLYSAPLALPPIAWSQRSDWINVKNAPYGAHGDGLHDDTHAIQAALNMASSKPNFPMTVYFPPGTYIISSELTANNTRSWKGIYGLAMVGSGCNTILQWRGARGGTMYLPNGAGRARYIGLTWNGANIAGYAISLSATTMKEDHVRIESDAFERFTGSAIYSYGGGDGVHDYASEVMVWNCLFSGCGTGMIVGSAEANDYDWTIEQDEFVNCGTGISVPTGKAMIFDDQFKHSGQCDITTRSQYSQRVRRCTSIGSASFFATTGGIQRATNAQIIQDCHIDSWTSNAGAIQLGNPGPNQVLDCVFTNPPGGNPPIVMSCSAAYPGLLTVEGNYCPTISRLVNSSSTVALETIPCGAFGNNIASPYMSFLQTAPSVDGANILDVTEAPYHADRTGHMDSTATIQAAINAAEATGGGTIVYFPSGLYKISSTLAVTGSNFSIEGSGFRSQPYWCGVVFPIALGDARRRCLRQRLNMALHRRGGDRATRLSTSPLLLPPPHLAQIRAAPRTGWCAHHRAIAREASRALYRGSGFDRADHRKQILRPHAIVPATADPYPSGQALTRQKMGPSLQNRSSGL
jgi:hypothetical protein